MKLGFCMFVGFSKQINPQKTGGRRELSQERGTIKGEDFCWAICLRKAMQFICWSRTGVGGVLGGRIGNHILEAFANDFKASGFPLAKTGNHRRF